MSLLIKLSEYHSLCVVSYVYMTVLFTPEHLLNFNVKIFSISDYNIPYMTYKTFINFHFLGR
jgi:hypothetical protein